MTVAVSLSAAPFCPLYLLATSCHAGPIGFSAPLGGLLASTTWQVKHPLCLANSSIAGLLALDGTPATAPTDAKSAATWRTEHSSYDSPVNQWLNLRTEPGAPAG